MVSIGYCLWCGAEITVACYDVRSKLIEWEKCRAFHPCKGAMITVITDNEGFVVFPRNKQGCYIYARKLPDKPCKNNGQGSPHSPRKNS